MAQYTPPLNLFEYGFLIRRELSSFGFTLQRVESFVLNYNKTIEERWKEKTPYRETAKLICKLWVDSL